MSLDPLHRAIREALEPIRLGPPLTDREGRLPHLTVYPLLGGSLPPGLPEILPLADGRDAGAMIEEVSCEDAVRVSNPLDLPILGGESECLVGRTQNRALKHDVRIPPRTSRYVLVNCVERGQPTRPGKEFAVGAVCPWSIRLDKMRQLAARGRVDQDRVWHQVDRYLARANAPNPTGDLHAAFDRLAGDLVRLLPSFPPLPGQRGAMSAIGPHLYLDLLPDPELWMRRHPALLGSVLAEGMVSHTDVRLPLDAARRALDGLLQGLRYGRSMQARFAAPGDRTLAAWGPGASAAAFQGVDGFHHLSAHWTWRELETDGPGRTARLAEERRRYLEENRDWFASMREASEDRHRRYTEWLVGLRARAPVSRVRARCLRGMAGPPPGYRVGVEEADPTAAFPATPGPDDLLRAVSRTASRTCDDFTADLASVRTCLDGLRMDPSRLRGLA